MTVNFIVNPIAINGGWSPWDARVGGTEECVIQWANELNIRGYNVSVYHNGTHGEYKGVWYRPHNDYFNRQPGLSIAVNFPDLELQEKTIYWTTFPHQGGRPLSQFAAVVGISQYQLDNDDLQHKNLSIIPPGYFPEQFTPEKKLPKSVLYASSPDRGLDNLLAVWPEVIKEVPDAMLTITYGGQTTLPNTICLGQVNEAEMVQLFRESDIWCHPAKNGELYCISGIKAQASGCWPVYFPIMALKDTVTFGTKSTQEALAQDLITALNGHPEPEVNPFPTWQSTTDQWEELLANC